METHFCFLLLSLMLTCVLALPFCKHNAGTAHSVPGCFCFFVCFLLSHCCCCCFITVDSRCRSRGWWLVASSSSSSRPSWPACRKRHQNAKALMRFSPSHHSASYCVCPRHTFNYHSPLALSLSISYFPLVFFLCLFCVRLYKSHDKPPLLHPLPPPPPQSPSSFSSSACFFPLVCPKCQTLPFQFPLFLPSFRLFSLS